MWLIVGAGLSGAVMAQKIATLGHRVRVIDKRDHIGGNCYDFIDKETGIRMNKYGAHLFHTDDQGVWEYINRFCKWVRWEHRVLSMVEGQYVPVPVNITTVNMLVDGANLKDSQEMRTWLDQNVIKCDHIVNSEQMGESRVGRELYLKMFRPYTIKQWNRDPKDLDASVLGRIPVRDNFDVRYFPDKYQALPQLGYTHFFERLLSHPLIHVDLQVDFFDLPKAELDQYQGVIYTGPIDRFFKYWNGLHDDGDRGHEAGGHEAGNGGHDDDRGGDLEDLEYRSIDFKVERFKGIGYYQPNSVVNYPELQYPFTRIVEYKHFLNQEVNSGVGLDTVIVSETTNDYGEPYYPVPTERNMRLYAKYQKLADQLSGDGRIYFLGRLATYKYYNMDQAIRAALDMFEQVIRNVL
jgi:UDP-galactopyranose mutase